MKNAKLERLRGQIEKFRQQFAQEDGGILNEVFTTQEIEQVQYLI